MPSPTLWLRKIANDRLLLFFAVLTIVLCLIQPEALFKLNAYIHWPTIITLTGLLILTTGMQQSGVMQQWAGRLIGKLETERSLWLVLISLSAISAMFLTNDIALFLIIPFTLQLHRQTPLKIRPLLIFETIAVNVGSMLTPIGNPQNIYLWQKAHLSFFSFVIGMLPPFCIQVVLLWTALFFISGTSTLNLVSNEPQNEVNHTLAWVSAIVLIAFLIAHNLGAGIYATVAIALIFLAFYRPFFLKVDWNLILLFLLLFVDVGILAGFPFLKTFTASFNTANPLHAVALGAGYSQIISNVPATLLLSHHIHHWKYLAWGVNLGANGLLIASFANLITVRLARPHKLGLIYHAYALPFLLASGVMVYFLLF